MSYLGTQTQVVIFIGPPGSGKGSQAALIKAELQLPHISTGDLLRQNIEQKTNLGNLAKNYVSCGQLVPDELMFEMLFAHFTELDYKKGYILDGFPRTLSQGEHLDRYFASDYQIIVIHFTIPDALLIERITKRQICKTCQSPYHLQYAPSRFAGVCDHCQGELYQRNDDKQEIIATRLQAYHQQTAPLIDYYTKKKLLHSVDARQSKEAVLSTILQILN